MSNRRLTSSIAGIARLIDPGIGFGLVLALNYIKPKPSCSRRYKLAKLPSNQQLELPQAEQRAMLRSLRMAKFAEGNVASNAASDLH
jgi:hypothetical protein